MYPRAWRASTSGPLRHWASTRPLWPPSGAWRRSLGRPCRERDRCGVSLGARPVQAGRPSTCCPSWLSVGVLHWVPVCDPVSFEPRVGRGCRDTSLRLVLLPGRMPTSSVQCSPPTDPPECPPDDLPETPACSAAPPALSECSPCPQYDLHDPPLPAAAVWPHHPFIASPLGVVPLTWPQQRQQRRPPPIMAEVHIGCGVSRVPAAPASPRSRLGPFGDAPPSSVVPPRRRMRAPSTI